MGSQPERIFVVVIDANVYIQALVDSAGQQLNLGAEVPSGSYNVDAVALAFQANEVHLYISDHIMEMVRQHTDLYEKEYLSELTEFLISIAEDEGRYVPIPRSRGERLPDHEDNQILDLAEDAFEREGNPNGTVLIITHNMKDFDLANLQIKKIIPVTPRDFARAFETR